MEPQVRDACHLPPGHDYLTNSILGPFIDTGVDVDRDSRWGRIYLSEQTVGEFARKFGWISPDDFKGLSHRLAEMTAENDRLVERVAKLDMIRDALVDAGFAKPEPEPEVEVEVEVATEATEATEGLPDGEYPAHQGAGWYLLSNGEKVRGEDEANEAQAALNQEAGE